VTAEQVAEDRDQQPEPQHEDKYRKDVGQKVGECEAAWEQHFNPPYLMTGAGTGVSLSETRRDTRTWSCSLNPS
jgi:hypothetical protein